MATDEQDGDPRPGGSAPDRPSGGRAARQRRQARWDPVTIGGGLTVDGRVVVSTDMLVEGRVSPGLVIEPHDVGRKAIAQYAADIEAMGSAAIALRGFRRSG